MHELRLVAVSEDGSYAVLAVPGRGGRYLLPIDDRLRTVARGHFSRLAQYEIEVENPLRPKEIQDRIRAGETADEIADVAGVPIERVRRFEGPILAEREYQAQEAQRATVRSPGDPGPGPRLGDVVADRLAELGAAGEDARWDSRKRADGNWQVQLTFTAGGRPYVAEWIFDPRRRHVAPDDDQAARLCLAGDDLPGLRFAERGPATVTPIASRLGGQGGSGQGAGGQGAGGQGAGTQGAGTQGIAAGMAPHHPEHRTSAPPPGSAAGLGVAARPATPAAAGQASWGAAAENRPGELDTAVADGRPDQARERPAQKAAGGRSRRASVPSWDEIMLGNSRDHD